MRRPPAVVISCIILGFAAFCLLATAGLFLFILTFAGMGAFTQPGQPVPDPSIMHGVLVVFSLICVALAAWAIATLVGLACMKSWARASVMVIGTLITLTGLLATFGVVASQFLVAPAQAAPAGAAALRLGMIFGVLIDLSIAGTGIWWLTYYSLSSTREAFARAAVPQPHLYPPSPYSASTYQVASYAPPAVPQPPTIYPAEPRAPAPPARPLTITILAWLFIAAAVLSIPSLFLPFPTFIFGMTLSGWPAHLTLLCFVLLFTLIGIGLLRLEKAALYTACAFQTFGILNYGLLVVPAYRHRMMAYLDNLIQKMSFGLPTPPLFDAHMMAFMMVPSMLFGIAFCITVLFLLIRNRAAFNRPSPQAAA